MIPVGFGYGEQSMSDPFQPFVSRAPNGFAGGFGTPPMRPVSNPFQPFIGRAAPEQNLTPTQQEILEKQRLDQYAYLSPGPTQEQLARNEALYGNNGSQVVRNPFGVAGGVGTPPMGRDPFQPFTDNPVGVAGGVGNPMQDIFQQFMERQRQGAGGFGGPQTTMNPTMQPQPPMGRDPFRRSDEGIPLWMQLGQPNPNQPVGIAGGVGTPAMGDYSMYAPEYRPGGQYGPTPPNPFGVAGGIGTPPNRPMPDPFKPQISGGPVSDPMQDSYQAFMKEREIGAENARMQPITQPPIGQPMTQPPAGGTPPMTQPPVGGLSYNDGFYNPPSAPRQPLTQPPAPVAMKKGGFAVKPVWDKKRPKDLGKPKDLSAKKEKSAKARAKAAGRPYPNLIDNMAVARKKGK